MIYPFRKISLVLLVLIANTAYAQNDKSIKADLDGDGKEDSFWIGGDGDVLQYKLSSQGNVTKSSKPLDISGFTNTLRVSKNVVSLSAWAMRAGSEYKFRYDKVQKDFRIIGYDSENFGPATNDGSGKSSYNLLTGDYVANWNHFDEKKEQLVALPTVKKKVPAKKYYLTSFSDKVMEEISGIDYKLLPSVLK